MKEDIKTKIRALQVKGFKKEEIAKILKIDEDEIEDKKEDLSKDSMELYTELQRDLSRLILTEFGKESKDKDSNVILNAIKLQAELQEKKISINKTSGGVVNINKDYIYKRDEEINDMVKSGRNISEVAKIMKMSELNIKQALDRFNLNLPEELKSLSPTIISETIGLNKETRMKILNDAYQNKYTRKEVREIVNNIKNETR